MSFSSHIQRYIQSQPVLYRAYHQSEVVLKVPTSGEAVKKRRMLSIMNPTKTRSGSKLRKPVKSELASKPKVQTKKTVFVASGPEKTPQEIREMEAQMILNAKLARSEESELAGVDDDFEDEEFDELDMLAEGASSKEMSEADYQAMLEGRHERSEVYKAKNKAKVMEKRRKREEIKQDRFYQMHGVKYEEKDGLVGIAERQAKQNPSVNIADAPRKPVAGEHVSRKKHPQPPGGRHERVDPELFPEHVLWPNRDVNINMEFPHDIKTKDPKLEAFWLKEHDKHVAPPKWAVDRGLVDAETAAARTREAVEEEVIEEEKAREEATTGKRSLSQLKREKRAALLPEWAKTPIAVSDLVLAKAIHGKGRTFRQQVADERKESQLSKTSDDGLFSEVNEHGVTWKDLGIGEDLIKALDVHWHIRHPTEIQQLTIPPFMEATNLLIADQTGTGKTLSYLLPMLERLAQWERKNPYFKRRGQRARVLILLPNRELVAQTLNVLEHLVSSDDRFQKWQVYGMAGGVETIKKERVRLNDGLDVLISTPDRVLMHVEFEHLYLDDTTIVIFDEADTLMSSRKSNEATQNFMTKIRQVIANQTSTHAKHVQFICASATVSPPLMEFLKKEFGTSMTSVVGNDIHKSARSLRQDFLFGASGDFKRRLLFSTMKKHAGKRTIIFCNTQAQCKGVTTLLNKNGYPAVAMTSDMPPKIRQRNFLKFGNNETHILVSTDLASRGLDLGATVEHVILYDFPTNTIDYLHRIGRTARAGAAGMVTAFLGKDDQGLAASIRDTLASGKSLASIQPKKPDIKTIHSLQRKIP